MPSDTHPDAEQAHIELIRQTTGAQRIAQLRSLTSFAIGLSRRAIARVNPHLTRHEVDLLWVEYTYGRDLAAKLRRYTREKSPCTPTTR